MHIHVLYSAVSSGYVARESVRVANLTVPDQAFGIFESSLPLAGQLTFIKPGVVNQTTVPFTDLISGILGLGFPRLSQIYNTTAHGNDSTLRFPRTPSEIVPDRNPLLLVSGVAGDSGLPPLRYLSRPQFE